MPDDVQNACWFKTWTCSSLVAQSNDIFLSADELKLLTNHPGYLIILSLQTYSEPALLVVS